MKIGSTFSGWLVASAVIGTQFALAQEASSKSRESAQLFERLDANKDGQVAADELPEDRKSYFERLVRLNDKNQDGKLSREEFVASLQEERPQPGRPESSRPQPGQSPPNFDAETLFRRLDANRDGKVVADEMPDERREQFRGNLQRFDKDGDGGLNLDEYREMFRGFAQRPGQPGPPPPGPDGRRPNFADAPFFRAIDSNLDGKLSADELASAGEALKKLDRNQDGFLTPEELVPPGPPGPGSNPPPPAAGAAGLQAFRDRIKAADRNGDGKLSKEEAPDRMKENFDRLDSNRDGFIDASEAGRLLERDRRPGRPNRDARPDQKKPDNK